MGQVINRLVWLNKREMDYEGKVSLMYIPHLFNYKVNGSSRV